MPSEQILQSGIKITAIDSDKSLYEPGSTAVLKTTIVNDNSYDFKGRYKITVTNPFAETNDGYGYKKIIREGRYHLKDRESKQIRAKWQTPTDNGRGYIVTAEFYDEGERLVARSTSAIDVSKDWTQFPRYAALTNFDPIAQTDADNVKKDVETLNKYHINAAMYYDAYYRPQNPFPSTTFKTWLGDDVSTRLIRHAISYQHRFGQKALFYNMINATTGSPLTEDSNMSNKDLFQTVQKEDGTTAVTSKMGLFRTGNVETSAVSKTFDAFGEQQTNNMLSGFDMRNDVDHKVQSYYNPFSSDWQDYIGQIMQENVQKLGFDGWQGDTIGDSVATSYENKGTYKDMFHPSWGYGVFTDKMKETYFKNNYFGLNTVSNAGQDQMHRSKADFQYSELWSWDHPTYKDLADAVNHTMKDTKKSLIVPAYMYKNYEDATHFKDEAILLKDAVVAANGGSSMELADNGNQLFSEFYPDTRKSGRIKMTDTLGNPDTGKLRKFYDFITGYENLLRGGNLQKTENRIAVFDEQGNQIDSSDAKANSVYTITKSGHDSKIDDAETISLINLLNVSQTNWNVTSKDEENQKNVIKQTNLRIKYYPDKGRDISFVRLTSPDSDFTSSSINVPFEKGSDEHGLYITFIVPSLEIWNLIYMK